MNKDVIDFVISFVVLLSGLFVICGGLWFAFSGYNDLLDATGNKEWIQYEKSKQCVGRDLANPVLYNITGLSMRPSLWPGDLAWGYPVVDGVSFVEGDLLAVNSSSQGVVLHRVVGLYKDYFVMQGDNSRWRDSEHYRYDSVVSVICAVQK